MRTFIFDSQAILVLYLGESGADRVAKRLTQIVNGEALGYVNIFNLTEVYYILCRKNKNLAEEKERNLLSFGVKAIPVTYDDGLWRLAASIKAIHSLSLADAFAVASANRLKATLVTGSDTEFDSLLRLRMERV